MAARRTRSPRSRKTSASQPPPQDVAGARVDSVQVTHTTDPTVTSQLRALEAGWDELLA